MKLVNRAQIIDLYQLNDFAKLLNTDSNRVDQFAVGVMIGYYSLLRHFVLLPNVVGGRSTKANDFSNLDYDISNKPDLTECQIRFLCARSAVSVR